MTLANQVRGDLLVEGTVYCSDIPLPANAVTDAAVSSTAAIQRSKLEQTQLALYPVNLTDFRVWDALQTLLPGTSSSDDLGLYGGTFGTASPLIRTYDVKTAGAVSLRARVLVRVPVEYDAANDLQFRIKAGMVTTVADTTATIDVEAYEVSKAGGIGSDLVTTSATSINSLSFANKDFTLTAAGLVAGDVLDVRVTIAVNDAAGATAVIAAFGGFDLMCDVRG